MTYKAYGVLLTRIFSRTILWMPVVLRLIGKVHKIRNHCVACSGLEDIKMDPFNVLAQYPWSIFHLNLTSWLLQIQT